MLLEVLVSIIICSIGLLGLAALQIVSLRNSTHSYMRSQATLLAQNIADRMRVNLPGVVGGSYHMTTVPDDPGFNCSTTFPLNQLSCDKDQMAQVDLYEWTTSVRNILLNGTGIVCVDSVKDSYFTPDDPQCDTPTMPPPAGSIYAIKIAWDENRDGHIDANDPVLITSLRLPSDEKFK